MTTRLDPTRTTMMRRQLQIRLAAPLKQLRRDIEHKIRSERPDLAELDRWLTRRLDNVVLPNNLRHLGNATAEAYDKGARAALANVPLSGINSARYNPIVDREQRTLSHLDTVAQTNVRGVLDATKSQVLRVYAEQVLQDVSDTQLVNAVKDRIDKIGITRIKATANTEVIRAHAEGALDQMQRLNITEVGINVEWRTGSDPCPRCSELGGKVFPLTRIRGMLPLHPNCRCTPVPVKEMVNRRRLQSAIARVV